MYSEEKISNIIERLATKLNKKKEDLFFIYNGKMIEDNLTFIEQANENDKKRNKMSILVNKKNESIEEDDESLKKSEYIICPLCKERARINIDNYKLEFYDCKNGHKVNNILINDFEQSQNINEAKIICQNCNKINKGTSYNNIFYICYDCKKNICPLCKSLHDKTHNIIDYEDKFFTCEIHYESYYSYCSDCKKDLCVSCENEHEGHKIITYGSLLPNVKKVKEEISNFNIKIEEFKNNIKNMINILNNLIYSIDNYYSIYQSIINSYGNKKRNYFLLQNIKDMNKFNNDIIQDIDKIINNNNISDKFNDLFNIYQKINIINKDIKNNDKESDEKNNTMFNQPDNNIDKSNNIVNNQNEEDLKNKDLKVKEKILINKEKSDEKNKEEKKDSNDNDIKDIKNINENIYKNNKIIEINNELMANSEKNIDNNYKDFDISKMKKICTFKTEIYFILDILVLKDERLFISGRNDGNNGKKVNYFHYVIDLKNGNIINLKLKDVEHDVHLIQMDDGLVCIFHNNSKMYLLDIKEKDYEIIHSYTLDVNDIYKMSNQNIIIFVDFDSFYRVKSYIYKNRKFIRGYEKDVGRMKKIDSFDRKSPKIVINEKEIVFYYGISGMISYSYYIGFFDLEKDKNIKSFSVERQDSGHGLALLNEDILIYTDNNKIYPVYLKNHSRKKEFKIENAHIHIIIPLHDNIFIASDNYIIYQFELDIKYKLNMISKIELNNINILKYPKNRLISVKREYKKDSNYICLYY